MTYERLPEVFSQKVGLLVEEGVYESAATSFPGLVEVDDDVAEVALHLAEHRLERVPLAVAPHGDVVGSVVPHHHYRQLLDAARQSEQQAERSGVGPLQVVDDEQQRRNLAQTLEDVDVLFVHLSLVEVGG